MSHNSLDLQGFKQLAGVLTSLTSLTRLNLASTAMKSEGAGLVVSSLPSCTRLKHLDLSSNAIVIDGLLPPKP